MDQEILELPEPSRPTAADIDFPHPSEREFAEILDFYGVRWQYEPTTFAIEWDEETGEPAKFFCPDFYLPEDDKYIEITTMRQKLITKKNRKVRLLSRHYPDIDISLFTIRDMQQLGLHMGTLTLYGKPIKKRRPGPARITRLSGRGANGTAVRVNPAIAQVPKERP